MTSTHQRSQLRRNPGPSPRNNQVIYPRHLGYYKKRGLSPTPIVLTQQDIENGQLDKTLIEEINSTEGGYRFTGQVVDYGSDHDHEPILKNTVVLENYVNTLKPKQEAKNKTKSQMVEFGFENTYRVMELITDDYELYYSKEIDGFDGDEPVEIRGANENWGLNAQKILYRSAALADMKKIVVMVSDDEFLIRKVTIVDDFTRHDSSLDTVKTTFFRGLNAFFEDYLPILKRLKNGKITKAGDGIAIQPSRVALSEGKNVSVVAYFLEPRLWEFLKLNTSGERVISLENFVPSRDRKIFLCLADPQTANQELQRLDRETVLGCFVQYENLQKLRPDYSTTARFWRKVIYSAEPDLLHPLRLMRQVTCSISPYFYSLPFPRNISVSNDAPWVLSSTDNLLFGKRREDIERLLTENFASWPLPKFSQPIPMTVYCQEPCEDLLQTFFDDNITFTGPGPEAEIIFCTIRIVPEEDYKDTIYRILELTNYEKEPPPSADLYLISRNDVIYKKWNNKNDLQLLEDFNGLDPIRQFPKSVVLFSSDQGERDRVSAILVKSHIVDYSDPSLIYFIDI